MADADSQTRGWIQIAVQTLGVIVVAILFVSRIEKQADVLSVNLTYLTSAVQSLNVQVSALRDVTQSIDKRLVKIESAEELRNREDQRRLLDGNRRVQ